MILTIEQIKEEINYRIDLINNYSDEDALVNTAKCEIEFLKSFMTEYKKSD